MSNLDLHQQLLQTIEALSVEDQQEVLDFAEFLWKKRQKTVTVESAPQSFFEVAKVSIGTGEGPGDLSTNPAYLQGYGQ